MASMIIFLIGCFKPFLFNKITNKHLRCFLLSITNVFACFVAVFYVFWKKDINFDYYWFVATLFCGFCIVLYWAYENLTQIRPLVHKIGKIVWAKFSPIIKNTIKSLISKLNDTKEIADIVDDFVNKNDNKTKSNKNDTKGL